MKLFEVDNSRRERKFIKVGHEINREQSAWIRPLDQDIKGVFDPEKNKTFRFGRAIRWILVDDQGRPIGRIAAYVNERTAKKDNKQPTGGIGFFDCVNDQQAANALFDRARIWLEEQGMEAMDGPINFGDRNTWWGLLIDGFEFEPNYQTNYNPPYYRELFEKYGFQIYFKQFTFTRKVADPITPKLKSKAEMIAKDPAYTFRHMRKKNLDKYAEDFRKVYNAAWAKHTGVAEMTRIQSESIMKKLKPIMDEKIIWFGYYHDEPVAFYVNIPEINQVFKYLNGRFDWLGKLKFLWYKQMRPNRKMLGVVFGIAPAHQGKGVDGAIVESIRKLVHGDYKKYVDLELNWIGDFNPRMIRVAEQVGVEISKTHATYRYLFDRSQPFERMPINH